MTVIREIENAWIPLAGGTRLAARIWLPEDAAANPVPAILEYLPYRKRDGTWDRDALTHPWFARHGYASVRVDLRGSGESDGVLLDEYAQQEQDDALEVIAWIARQDWCSGAVGMMGISWGGFNALQVAALRPPALKAIVTICSTDDRYRDDVHFMGGALLTSKLGWASAFQAIMAHPPDPALVGERWREMWRARLEDAPLFLERWLRHQRRDAYWEHGSVCEVYGAIGCPVFAVGGWTDGYTNAIPRLLENLSVPRKGLIGPWAHRYPHFALPGPPVGFLQEALRWWDTWLKGIDTGVMDEPMLRAWMMESVRPAPWHAERPGRWIAETGWPPASRSPLRLFLSGGRLADAPGEERAVAIRSPQGLGEAGGNWCPFGSAADDAGDQREDDAASIRFDTAPLAARTEILGAPVVELDIACDKTRANLIARLCDVHPDGASLRVSYGVLNLAHRDGYERPAPLAPGRRYRIRIQLNDSGFAFPAGHRIRLALSTAYWPMLWPAPEVATVTVFAGSLVLPAREPRPEDATLRPMPPPKTAPPARRTVLREGASRREAGRDIVSGERFYRAVEAPSLMRIDAIGTELGSSGRMGFRIREEDPLSARAEAVREQTVRRGELLTRTALRTVLTATSEAFHVETMLEAFEGDGRVCDRLWDCEIERDQM